MITDQYSTSRRLSRRMKLWIRALLGRDLFPKTDIRTETEIHGAGYGEWRLISSLLNANAVVYSFGIGTDISFDRSLIEKLGITVHAFDPTPRVAKWLNSQRLPAQFVFHNVGLGAKDEIQMFNTPSDSRHISHTVIGKGSGGSTSKIGMEVRCLSSLMTSLGHQNIDLLKMDIEGAEYAVIEALSASGIRPKQLLVEFHHRWKEIGPDRTRFAIQSLRKMGYAVFAISDSGEEYSFLWLGPKQ